MRHIISVLLENEPGALSRVSGLFSARGYNIESLTVAPTHDATLSRMTIVTVGDDRKIDQIEKQLNKLVDVAALHDITVNRHIECEVALVKVASTEPMQDDLERLASQFGATLIDVFETTYIVQLSGDCQQIDELVAALGTFNIIEVARSGVTGLALGERSLKV